MRKRVGTASGITARDPIHHNAYNNALPWTFRCCELFDLVSYYLFRHRCGESVQIATLTFAGCRFPSWESRIYQVAAAGLQLTTGPSLVDNTACPPTTGYCDISVPVYATVKGVSRIIANQSSNACSWPLVSWELELQTVLKKRLTYNLKFTIVFTKCLNVLSLPKSCDHKVCEINKQ